MNKCAAGFEIGKNGLCRECGALSCEPCPKILARDYQELVRLRGERAEMIEFFKDIEFVVDGKEDADDGIANDAMKIMSVVQTALRKLGAVP